MSNKLRISMTVILVLIINCKFLRSGKLNLEESFQEPPIEARAKAYLCLVNGNFNFSRLSYDMREAKEKGMGGFDIWDVGVLVDPDNVIPAGPEFMGSRSLDAIAYILNEAEKLDMNIGLTLSSSWNAGGSWISPEEGVKALYHTDTVVHGRQNFRDKLQNPPKPKAVAEEGGLFQENNWNVYDYMHEVAVLAFPMQQDSIIKTQEILDISDNLDENGQLEWKVPSGKWKIRRYVSMPTGQPLKIPSPNSRGLMIDHFSARATEKNLRYILEKLEKRLGPLHKTRLKYLYTDSYEANSAAWTKLMQKEFRKRNGYDMNKYIPALSGYVVDNRDTTERFLYDFRKTLSDLIIDYHYDLSRQICAEYGIGFNAEAAGPGPPIHNCPFESIESSGVLSVPRGEFWYKHEKIDQLQIIKGVASASHLYNQKFVEAEAFTSVFLWQYGPGDIKQIADKAMCEGLNSFVYHTFPHSPPEGGYPGWVYNFGTIINTNRTWWPKSAAFHNYLARASYLLQQGNFVGDILYYYGDEAPNFVKPKGLGRYQCFGYDYDVTNSDVIRHRLQVKDNRLVLPHGQNYSILILPEDKRINLKVLKKLENLVKNGAVLVGEKPTRTYGLYRKEEQEQEIKKITERMWGNCDGINVKEHNYGKGKIICGKSEHEILAELGIQPDIKYNYEGDEPDIDFIHRKTKHRDIYFIRNISNKEFWEPVTFRIKKGTPQRWNPNTGKIKEITFYNQKEEGTTIPLNLAPEEATFIVFDKRIQKEHIAKIKKDDKSIITLDSVPVSNYNNEYITTNSEGNYKFETNLGKTINKTVASIPQDIYLNGSWEVYFDKTKGAPTKVVFDSLKSWTNSEIRGVKYFSGIASYRKSFNIEQDILNSNSVVKLDLGKVAKVAEVYINGKSAGISWFEPYQLDITDKIVAGKNHIRVEVANVLSNYLTGDAKLPEKYRRNSSNVKKMPTAWHTPWENVPLVESGLLGPVNIQFEKKIRWR